jgi:class 3 adenylate cyclase
VTAAEAPATQLATFVFADIAGFTALTEAHGDEQAAELVTEFCRAVQAELPASGGSQVKSIGDALMLRIPEPAAAIRLGLRIANGIMRDHGAPAVRVGLHHGPALERDGDYFGAAVNLAARVSGQAAGGEVLLTAHTAALAGELDNVLYESRGRAAAARRPRACRAGGRRARRRQDDAPNRHRPGLPDGRRPRARCRAAGLRRDGVLLLHAELRGRLRAPA